MAHSTFVSMLESRSIPLLIVRSAQDSKSTNVTSLRLTKTARVRRAQRRSLARPYIIPSHWRLQEHTVRTRDHSRELASYVNRLPRNSHLTTQLGVPSKADGRRTRRYSQPDVPAVPADIL